MGYMMIKNPPEMFIVEGRIQALRKANGTLNLIKDIQKGAWFTGMAAGLAGQAGMLANAASLALYEGDDVEHIALLINDKLAVGTFEWLEDIKIDDEVKLVVSEIEDGPLYIHAILRKSDQLLWTPFSIGRTRFGWVMHGIKFSALGVVGTWGIFGIGFLFRLANLPDKDDLFWLIIGPIILMIFVGFMSTTGLISLGKQAEDIYMILGVPKFNRFKVKQFSLMNLHFMEAPNSLKKGYIYKFDEALKSHKKKYKLN
ncbi:hypothetical protein AAKU55_005823 [Oxalobacteraceae bacterium GrIS 1.11]